MTGSGTTRVDVTLDLGPELGAPVAAALRRAGLAVDEGGAASALALVKVSKAPTIMPELAAGAQALYLVATGELSYSETEALAAGADGLAVWGETPVDVVAARVAALARRRSRDLDLHPLTRLPGGAALAAALLERLPERGQVALTGYDIRHFKAYNDRHGFSRGDEVLQFLADVLVAAAGDRGQVYHLGGDDFYVLTTPSYCDGLAAVALELFSAGVARFHGAEDLRRGYVVGLDRQSGEPREYPLMGLTAATACNEAPDMAHPGQLAQVIAELKAYARSAPGSRHIRDRRQIHDTARSLALRPEARGQGAAES